MKVSSNDPDFIKIEEHKTDLKVQSNKKTKDKAEIAWKTLVSKYSVFNNNNNMK